jgi:PAS domain S-box-containing protein
MSVKPSLRVLIVEDNDDDLQLLLHALRRGYEVDYVRAETAEEMAEACATQEFALIISDFSLPVFSAPAAVALVQARGLDLPVIIVSGTIDEEAAVEALRAGADDFMSKGRLARLLPSVARSLREAAGRRASRQEQQRYRRIVENTSAGICLLDADGQIRLVNRRLAAILALEENELTGKPFTDAVDELSRPPLAKSLAQLQRSAQQLGVRCTRADGDRLWLLLDIVGLFAENGAFEGAVATVLDVTKRVAADSRAHWRDNGPPESASTA